MNPIILNDKNFQKEVIESHLPVLVDFWAPWCAPCHQIAPMMDELAYQYYGRFKIAKINTDESRVADNYHISSIPSLLIFKNGRVMEQITGAVPKNLVTDRMDDYCDRVVFYN